MTEEKGRHFDPEIFECFLQSLPEFHQIRREMDVDVRQVESVKPKPKRAKYRRTQHKDAFDHMREAV